MRFVETQGNSVDPEGNRSFMRLFKFIGGTNESKQKISMTTPVFMEGEQNNMAFVMPANMSLE